MKKVLLLYPYYWPHYKAGGPVQSLFNLAGFFRAQAKFYFVSRMSDIDGRSPSDIVLNKGWVTGPQNENVYFSESLSPWLIIKVIRKLRPARIFVNGLFNFSTAIGGTVGGGLYGIPVIISPRGVLQGWALKNKKWKKTIFIFFFKWLLPKKLEWHATDDKESDDIKKHFGMSHKIYVAGNVPRAPLEFRNLSWPVNGPLKLIFLSLINPNKNLHLVIKAVLASKGKFILDIYGPASHQEYWRKCQAEMKKSPQYFNYYGPLPPWEIPDVISNYHFFILPTEGENFGHAIFDALGGSVPVIISRRTPWGDLKESGAGVYVDLNEDMISGCLMEIANWSPDTYSSYRRAAHHYAEEFWNKSDFPKSYSFLFNP